MLYKYRLRIQACLSFELLFLSSRPPRTMGVFVEMMIAGRKCLCVSRKMVLWLTYFYVGILVLMTYSKLWNIYLYIIN